MHTVDPPLFVWLDYGRHTIPHIGTPSPFSLGTPFESTIPSPRVSSPASLNPCFKNSRWEFWLDASSHSGRPSLRALSCMCKMILLASPWCRFSVAVPIRNTYQHASLSSDSAFFFSASAAEVYPKIMRYERYVSE